MYDLPAAMMKESCARQLGEQIGTFVKMDTRFPGYLRVRINFLLPKALMPELKVKKLKGRGIMGILLRYENVPHFCFSCGRIGHAALSCTMEEPMDQGIKYGEELRTSPPRRVREVLVKRTPSRATRQLFQVDVHQTPPPQYANVRERVHAGDAEVSMSNVEENLLRGHAGFDREETDAEAATNIAESIKELQVACGRCGSRNASCGNAKGKRKDRVSFGTNMTTTEEESLGIWVS